MADPRGMKAFGVAGALSSGCTVFYTSDFRSRNIGRLSDLMAARLRDVNGDELRLRALLLFSLYESYAALGKTFRSLTDVPPVSLEIGYDENLIAISVSFHWKEGKPPVIPGLSQRVSNGVYQTPFEEVLGFLRQHCAKLTVKFEDKERRIEILTLLDRHEDDRRDPMEVIEVDSTAAPFFEASEYVEMGDLDYLALIGETTRSTASTGEEVAQSTFEGAGAEDDDLPRKVEGEAADFEDFISTLGAGNSGEVTDTTRVSGTLESDEVDARRIQAQYQAHIQELQRRIAQLEAEKSDSLTPFKAEKEKDQESGWGLSFLKKMFGGDDPQDTESETLAAEEEEPTDPLETLEDGIKVEPDPRTQKIIDELKTIANNGKGSAAFQQVVQEITEADSKKGKRWADGLMSEVLQEKARLAELSRELTKQARQREMDYRMKERAMQNEVSRMAELARRKDALLERNKEQIAQLNLALERSKSAASGSEDQQNKLRLNTAQRLVQSKEEEIRVLAQKVKALEDRLIVAQARSSRPAVDPQMLARLQTAERKVDELKRANQRLSEAANAQKQNSNDKDSAGLRRKVETMERQTAEMKRNLEKAQFRVRELQESERKIQVDLQKTLEENRKLRGGRDGGGQAA